METAFWLVLAAGIGSVVGYDMATSGFWFGVLDLVAIVLFSTAVWMLRSARRPPRAARKAMARDSDVRVRW